MTNIETVWVIQDAMGYVASESFDAEAVAQRVSGRMTLIGVKGLTVIEVAA